MKKPLQLSDELIAALHETVAKFDERAKDPGIAVQYYAAVMGCVVGQQDFSMSEKQEFLKQLFAFSNHVLQDVAGETAQESTAEQQATGKWKPGDN